MISSQDNEQLLNCYSQQPLDYFLVPSQVLVDVTNSESEYIGDIADGTINLFEAAFAHLKARTQQGNKQSGSNRYVTGGRHDVRSIIQQQLSNPLARLFKLGSAELEYNIVKATPAYLSDNLDLYLTRLNSVGQWLLNDEVNNPMAPPSLLPRTDKFVVWCDAIVTDGVEQIPLALAVVDDSTMVISELSTLQSPQSVTELVC